MSNHIPLAPALTAEALNFSGTGTANASGPTQSVPGIAPAMGITPTTFPLAIYGPTTEIPQTFNEKLKIADRYWKFKAVLQAIVIFAGFIGIGTIGWCVSTSPNYGYINSTENLYWPFWPALITFSISIIWCVTCILVLVTRKRPVHPGLRVAIDLLLWLGFAATVSFVTVALKGLLDWGKHNNIGFFSSYGDYVLLDNGTWVWEARTSPYTTTLTRECNNTNPYYPSFRTCAEVDAHVNQLWREKPHRSNVALTGAVCQFLSLVLHIVLFIWACVDCNRYRGDKPTKDAQKIAAGIVQTMIANGAIIPPPGQAQVKPAAWDQTQMEHNQLPQQQDYAMATMYSQNMPPSQPGPQQYRGA